MKYLWNLLKSVAGQAGHFLAEVDSLQKVYLRNLKVHLLGIPGGLL